MLGIFDSIIVSDVISALTVTSCAGRREIIKERKSYGLSFCIDGMLTYTHNGNEYVSKQGYAIILPKGETYELYGNKNGLFPVINFDTVDTFCDTHILIPIDNLASFLVDYSHIRSCLMGNNRIKALSIFYEILHKLSSQNHYLGIIAPAIEYIKSNISTPELNNSLLAEKCNVSEVYFRKLFIEKTKSTPRQYIIDLRIAKAKELLADGAIKIGTVAEECGFTNPYHFCRVFKARVGETPGEYLNKNKVYKI